MIYNTLIVITNETCPVCKSDKIEVSNLMNECYDCYCHNCGNDYQGYL